MRGYIQQASKCLENFIRHVVTNGSWGDIVVMQAISIALKRPIWSINQYKNATIKRDLTFNISRLPVIITLGDEHWSGTLLKVTNFECDEPLCDADKGLDFILSQ